MRLLFDTTVVIDMLRGLPAARDCFAKLEAQPFLSAISVAELYSGMREGRERQFLERLRLGFAMVAVDDQIAEEAGILRRQYGKSHGTGLADAMIAACANTVGATLVTHNLKHYPMLKNAVTPYRYQP